MDEEDAQAKADIKFQAKKEQAAKELEERTSKKRSKRQKKKVRAPRSQPLGYHGYPDVATVAGGSIHLKGGSRLW